MSLRQLCKEGNKAPTKALFLFPQEMKTGIAPTRQILEKDVPLAEGNSVTVNWAGRRVKAQILALHGKYSTGSYALHLWNVDTYHFFYLSVLELNYFVSLYR